MLGVATDTPRKITQRKWGMQLSPRALLFDKDGVQRVKDYQGWRWQADVLSR